MPDELRTFLMNCPTDLANRIWGWLDSDPNADEQMIQICAERVQEIQS